MSHEIDEYYRVYVTDVRQARKLHACDACGRAIRPGDAYCSVHLIDYDGTPENVKRCGRCETIHKHLRDRGCGDTWPAERLDCGESYEEHWGEQPPDIEALAFLTESEASALLSPAPRARGRR